MLLDAFGSLSRRLNEILIADQSVAERIELAAGAWVDAIVARPTLARLILRLVADGTAPATHGVTGAIRRSIILRLKKALVRRRN